MGNIYSGYSRKDLTSHTIWNINEIQNKAKESPKNEVLCQRIQKLFFSYATNYFLQHLKTRDLTLKSRIPVRKKGK